MIGSNYVQVDIAVTGNAWMGDGTRSISSVIESMLQNANNEIMIVAYAITEAVDDFIKQICDCLYRGIKVILIINRLTEQPIKIQDEISRMLKEFQHFFVFNFNPPNFKENLHAKVLVVDRSIALIGSSNLSWRGLVKNHELAVTIQGPSVGLISELVDCLIKDHRTLQVKYNV